MGESPTYPQPRGGRMAAYSDGNQYCSIHEQFCPLFHHFAGGFSH